MTDRFITRDTNIATFLIHAGGRNRHAVVLIADDGRPVFSFADSPQLQADVIQFTQGARVAAIEYGGAMRIVAKLTRQAHYRRGAVHQRIIAGRDVSETFVARHAGITAPVSAADLEERPTLPIERTVDAALNSLRDDVSGAGAA